MLEERRKYVAKKGSVSEKKLNGYLASHFPSAHQQQIVAAVTTIVAHPAKYSLLPRLSLIGL